MRLRKIGIVRTWLKVYPAISRQGLKDVQTGRKERTVDKFSSGIVEIRVGCDVGGVLASELLKFISESVCIHERWRLGKRGS